MSFTPYITYEEYVKLGGKVSEDAFPNLERKAQRELDAITFDRIKKLTTIPEQVKEVLTDFVDIIFSEQNGEVAGPIESYSNGVEKITIRANADSIVRKKLKSTAVEWLPDYLTARCVNYDFERYLRQTNNNP